jgi:DNA polymerase-1
MVSPEHDIKLYETTTLSGRPIRLLAESRQALNYQDQGTGADILARAIASLPEEIAAMMLMPVHDELVFEVPANEADEVKQAVQDTMVRAADQLLGGLVPVEVETAIGETWKKV